MSTILGRPARLGTGTVSARRSPQTNATVATVVDAPTAVPAGAPVAEAEQFVWAQNWFPVAVVECLDPSRPHPFTLMGKDLVLWRDGAGVWRAFEDACPHRLAPLSEGRVEKDGTLLCAYHAWRFDSSGKCASIPQVESKEAEGRACGSPRSCARVYLTQEAQGLLWVWGESGPTAAADSAAKGPALVPELEELPASRVQALPWFFRDLPYSYDYFVENVTDPAHVNVSHHNVAGNRYAPDQYFTVDPLREVTAAGGFKYQVKSRAPVSNVSTSSTEFLPPSLVKIKVEYKDGAALILSLYSCPTVPGHNRHVGRQILIKTPEGKLPPGLAFFAMPMPTWLAHATASVFLHQDQVFLHQQERIVAGRNATSHTAKYFMPAPSDNMTVAFRTWLGQHAGGGVPYAGGRTLAPIDRSKESLFDTYHTHTAQCAVCKPALGRLQAARSAALVVGVAALAAALLVTGVAAAAKAAAAAAAGAAASDAALAALASLPPLSAGIAAAVGLAAAAAVRVLDGLIGLMHKYEFSHADNH
ncbi:hypothetical protein HYH02_012944 [Chlamydomonas schloesseri]|uniref:Rieske domain-containing protein n=1 Tax=Chlamydomonas schloesseri TaxID=2026947 RepID=A0A835W191_9CHLO|nr:hypothetical protein HYH02_012944 [Chlamydomonas schloesseri]|eukprot:KAG2432371.1 hypothetical protein HYH02_012944 [Chlamydomonas schloesseri]